MSDPYAETDIWPVPARNWTLTASEPENAPTPTREPDTAREALVEQLAETLMDADYVANRHKTPPLRGAYIEKARMVAPLVAAQVEAAVSVVRAEADAEVEDCMVTIFAGVRAYEAAKARAETAESEVARLTAPFVGEDDWSGPSSGEAPTENTPEWPRLEVNLHPTTAGALKAIAERDGTSVTEAVRRLVLMRVEHDERAAPSPAEGTGEAVCCGDHDDDGGRPCNGCPERAPVSSGEAGSDVISGGAFYTCGHSYRQPGCGWPTREPDTAREALVEQLAEAIDGSMRRGRGGQAIFPPSAAVMDAARAVLPVVAAQVEAAVSVVRADLEAEIEEVTTRAEAAEYALHQRDAQLAASEAEVERLTALVDLYRAEWVGTRPLPDCACGGVSACLACQSADSSRSLPNPNRKDHQS